MDEIEKNNGEIIIYRTEDGRTQLEVRLENENVWLSQQQMSELFQTSRTNIVEHIKHIFEEGELEENSTCQIFRQVRIEGTRKVERSIPFYNLDMIISLGYRIKSRVATHFRRWATERLKEYLIKGFAMDEYQKYHVKTLSPVEEAYFDSIKKLTAETKKKKRNKIQ